MTNLGLDRETVNQEIVVQGSAIYTVTSEFAWRLEDRSSDQRGIHLSFLSATGLGEKGYVVLHFNQAGLLEKIIVESLPPIT